MKDKQKWFKVYVSIMLTGGLILLIIIVALLIYGGLKIKHETNVVDKQINSLNSQIKFINNNLVKIDNQLQLDKSISPILP